jgi:hypothetical protein
MMKKALIATGIVLAAIYVYEVVAWGSIFLGW